MRDRPASTAEHGEQRMSDTPKDSTLTLTDFLLARIAEDALNLVRLHDPLGFVDESCTTRWGERVAAECYAKREIVSTLRYCSWRRAGTERETLELLALPYADHPDYREEWRA